MSPFGGQLRVGLEQAACFLIPAYATFFGVPASITAELREVRSLIEPGQTSEKPVSPHER
jgi:hypothetical protein